MHPRTASAVLAILLALAGAAEAGTIHASGRAAPSEIDITHLMTIDPATAAVTDIGVYTPEVTQIIALAFDTDGTLYGSRNWVNLSFASALVQIDMATGALTPVVSFTERVWAMEIGPDGSIYGGDRYGNFCRIDRTSGLVSAYGTGASVYSLAFDTTGTLWSTDGFSLYTVDLTTGDRTLEAAVTGLGYITGMTFDDSDVLYVTTGQNPAPLAIVDPTTGAWTIVASTGKNVSALEWGPTAGTGGSGGTGGTGGTGGSGGATPVPLPGAASTGLALLVLLAVGTTRRRLRR